MPWLCNYLQTKVYCPVSRVPDPALRLEIQLIFVQMHTDGLQGWTRSLSPTTVQVLTPYKSPPLRLPAPPWPLPISVQLLNLDAPWGTQVIPDCPRYMPGGQAMQTLAAPELSSFTSTLQPTMSALLMPMLYCYWYLGGSSQNRTSKIKSSRISRSA